MTVIMSTVSTKGQTTIPEELRKELSIEPGHRLLWENVNGKLVATPAGNLMDLAGSLRSDKPYLPKARMCKVLQATRAKHYAEKLAAICAEKKKPAASFDRDLDRFTDVVRVEPK